MKDNEEIEIRDKKSTNENNSLNAKEYEPKEQRQVYKKPIETIKETDTDDSEIEKIKKELAEISDNEEDSEEEFNFDNNMTSEERKMTFKLQTEQGIRRLHRKQRNCEKGFNKEELEMNLNQAITEKRIIDERKSLKENFPLTTNKQLNEIISKVNILYERSNKRQSGEPEPGPSKKVKPSSDEISQVKFKKKITKFINLFLS